MKIVGLIIGLVVGATIIALLNAVIMGLIVMIALGILHGAITVVPALGLIQTIAGLVILSAVGSALRGVKTDVTAK